MTSTARSHGNIKRCRVVYVVDYALLAGKSGTDVLQKHPHHPIGSCGARDGGVLLGVSIEDSNQHECLSPRDVSYTAGCDSPCVYAQTKSYFDTNAEEWSPTATETQGDPSKGAEDEEIVKMFNIECHKKELEQCSIDTKRLIGRDTFKAKTGSYEGFSEHYVMEVLEQFPSHQYKAPTVETRRPQDQLYITGPEDMVETGIQGVLFQSQKTFTLSQDDRTQDAPEAMVKISSREKLQERMNFPKEANGISQDPGYITAPEAMVQFGKMSTPSQALAISLLMKDARNQDALKAMPKIDGRTSTAEPLWTILQNKAANIGDNESTTMKDSNTIMHQEGWKRTRTVTCQLHN
jgi:hypothetical protein